VLKPAQRCPASNAIVEDATKERNALIWPSLNKSREAFRRPRPDQRLLSHADAEPPRR